MRWRCTWLPRRIPRILITAAWVKELGGLLRGLPTRTRAAGGGLGRLLRQLCRLLCLPLRLAGGALLLGLDLLRLACRLQRLALLGARLADLARLEDHHGPDRLLAGAHVLALEGQRPHALGADHHPRLLQLPALEHVRLGCLRQRDLAAHAL